MPVHDIFSKRQKAELGEVPDTLRYDVIPHPLRVQIVMIAHDVFDDLTCRDPRVEIEWYYKSVYDILCREKGVFDLNELVDYNGIRQATTYYESVRNCLCGANKIEVVLDIAELCFRLIDESVRERVELIGYEITHTPDNAIEELNARFEEHGIGYQFESGRIIRIDSTFIHAEITKPALALLRNEKFAGAQDEFLKAHEHYRHGRNKECVTECCKAFESVLKTICKEKGWQYKPDKDTASELIAVCFKNELIPDYIQSQFNSLRSLLESGVPTLRNKEVAHGQGQTPQQMSDEITRYCLHLTAANIVFLIEQSGIK